MEFQFSLYGFLILIGAITTTIIAVAAWNNRRGVPLNTAFAILMSVIALWSYIHLMEHGLSDLRLKRLFLDIQYISIVLFVAVWLIFALAYTNRTHLLTRRNLALLAIHPITLLLLLLTNNYHHLFRAQLTFAANGATWRPIVEYGPFFWLHVVYSYAVIGLGVVLVVRANFQFPIFHGQQMFIISLSMFLPWALNAAYLMGLTNIDYTMGGLTLAGLCLGWGVWRLNLLDIVPLARTAVFQSLNDAIFTLDNLYNIVDFNPAARPLLSNPAQTIGQPFHTIFADQPALRDALATSTAIPNEITLTNTPDLTAVHCELSLSPLYGRQNVLKGHVLVIRDITARKLAEQAEREQRLLAEALRDLAVILNHSLDLDEVLDRILTNVNRVLPHDVANLMLLRDGVAHLVRYRGKGEPCLEKVKLQWLLADTPTLASMTTTSQPVILPDVMQSSDWRDIPGATWIRSYVGAPIQQDGKVIGFINLDSATPNAYRLTDGDRLQAFADQAAIALRNAQLFAQLTERNSELDAYARTIAHDLKSPLGLIYGYVELMAEYDLPPMAQGYLDIIRATIGRMEEMTEQLLLLAQLRDIHQTAVSIEVLPLIYDVISRFSDQIEAHKITLHLSEPLLPVRGHSPWLEEVLANLVGNAIKYMGRDNSRPTIHIACYALGDTVRYEITDSGLGIPPEKHDKIFEMFTRFHPGEASGTGLGLPIVQRIIHKMGGQVGVCSIPGEGSTFWFTLPAG